MNNKNLYKIEERYVHDESPTSIIQYIYADKNDIFKIFIDNYETISEDLEQLENNNGEIWMEHEDYDAYFERYIYWYEIVKSNISIDEAKEYICDNFLSIHIR